MAQCVNYSSEEEQLAGETDLAGRIQRAGTLLNMLKEWKNSLSAQFEPLPVESSTDETFKPLWIHPSPIAVSMQMYCMAKILLLVNQPAAGGYLEYLSRDKLITQCIDTIGGIALRLTDNASRLMSTQCLHAAGLYCKDPARRSYIVTLIEDHTRHTAWPPNNTDLEEELRVEWEKQQS